MNGYPRAKALTAAALLIALAGVVASASAQARKGKKADAPEAKAALDVKKSAPVPAGTLEAGTKLDAPALARHIDKQIAERARAEKVSLSPLADDGEFLRRVTLDLTGKIPTAEKARAFLDSTDPDKRRKLIDQLLASKDFGRYQADIWQALMLPRSSDNFRFRQWYPNLVNYLEESFNENKPWNKMATEIVTATGPVDKKGAAVYHLVNGPTVDKITDSVTKLFLGIQLQCAQCHNHPFTDYKQAQYWETAAFFLKTGPTGNPKAAAKGGGSISISESGPVAGRRGKVGGFRNRLPESGKVLPPRFFQGEKPKLVSSEPYRPVFAKWLTSADNPFFSKAMVNRTWGQLFGRGFVSPVDDMHEGNGASHPELVADLAQQFAANNFDLKYLFRAICNSEAYQRTSKPFGNNGDAPAELFARVGVKPLTPGQTYDSLVMVMGAPPARDKSFGKKGARFGPITPRQVFVNFFQIDDGADPLEYQAGIPQVLRLMNAPAFNRPGAVGPIVQGTKDWKEATEKLYLTTLARRPTEAELVRVGNYLKKNATDQRQGMADVLWVLINCSEFAMNH